MDQLNLPTKQSSEQELSAHEFQESLYNLLQDQELLSELRDHLQTKMSNTSQDKAAVNRRNQQLPTSPKVQALSILIADFLLQMGFKYTLSVFANEVPQIGQVSKHFTQSAIKKTIDSGYKFSHQAVENILESLGYNRDSEMAFQALSQYNSSGITNKVSEPLLLCIIRASSLQLRKEAEYFNNKNNIRDKQNMFTGYPEAEGIKSTKTDKDLTRGFKESWFDVSDDSYMPNDLMKLSPSSGITDLSDYTKRIHQEEISKIREEEAAKYQKLLQEKIKALERKELKEKHFMFNDWRQM